jgi:uncharacterized protein (DUF1697 family)
MRRYAVLLRGINVGGKNKVPMASLKDVLQGLGCTNVATYIASGNIAFDSHEPAERIGPQLEAALTENFDLSGEVVKALVLSREHLQAVIDNKPEHFGDRPDLYHSDAIFLIDVDAADAMAAFSPREGVDTVWPGRGVIYHQRLSAQRTKSRLNRVMASPVYKSMTIRSWGTTVQLWKMTNG